MSHLRINCEEGICFSTIFFKNRLAIIIQCLCVCVFLCLYVCVFVFVRVPAYMYVIKLVKKDVVGMSIMWFGSDNHMEGCREAIPCYGIKVT